MQNPFSLKVITDPNGFCNRTSEIQKLISYAQSNTNAVIYSQRRFGKTSLVKQVQQRLEKADFVTIYIDLFGLSSADTIASRITKGVYKALYEQKALWQKALATIKSHRPVIRPDETGFSITAEVAGSKLFGADLLDQTLYELGEFLAEEKRKTNIVLDEFQEITEIKDPNVEGIMRAHIQQHQASYYFVGSRRRVLLEMFSQKRRPFFQSAINFELNKLPHGEFAAFIAKRFEDAEKKCTPDAAAAIAATVGDHPYYGQKLAFFCYERADKKLTQTDVQEAYADLLQAERPVFEAIVQGLAPRQIALLKAVAMEPTKSILSMDYIRKHALKSIGGIQAAAKRLNQLDLLGKENDVWTVVDQVFARWLTQ
ncbi:MAG: AAA family ATPase [Desulfobacterales bacterium]|nr:AAA family ATPase [Desulfobacterales bacterium]